MGNLNNYNISNDIILEEVSCILCGRHESTLVAEGYDFEYWTSKKSFSYVQCNNCGHLYLNPQPIPESSSQIYPSNYYTHSGRHTEKSSKLISTFKKHVIRKRLKYILSKLPENPNILEIGCGDCSLLMDLKTIVPSAQLTGLDIAFTDDIKRMCQANNITNIEDKVENANLPYNEYDLVIMNQLIEHLWDPALAFKKIHKSLKKRGMISIETINTSGYDRCFFKKDFWGGYYFPRHLNIFSFESLRRLLEKYGFCVVKQSSLLAPIVWAFSFHALCSSKPHNEETFADKFFTDKNPLCLAIFTVIDIIARIFCLTTSNQKTIAKKAETP